MKRLRTSSAENNSSIVKPRNSTFSIGENPSTIRVANDLCGYDLNVIIASPIDRAHKLLGSMTNSDIDCNSKQARREEMRVGFSLDMKWNNAGWNRSITAIKGGVLLTSVDSAERSKASRGEEETMDRKLHSFFFEILGRRQRISKL